MQPNNKKITQIASLLLHLGSNEMSKMKLIKLMYLAERESLQKRGFPLTWDKAYSLSHGPILSHTLDLINEYIIDDYWKQHIKHGKEANIVELIKIADLSELSNNEIELIENIFKVYGQYSASRLRELTHEFEEYKESTGNQRYPIEYADILNATDSEVDAVETLNEINAISVMDRILDL